MIVSLSCISMSRKSHYHLISAKIITYVKKDLKKRSVKWMFCVFNKILIVFVGVYFLKQQVCCIIAKNHGFQALQTFQNMIEYRFMIEMTL